jgi:hypothetical protein
MNVSEIIKLAVIILVVAIIGYFTISPFVVSNDQLVEVVAYDTDNATAEILYEVEEGHTFVTYHAILPMRYIQVTGEKNYGVVLKRYLRESSEEISIERGSTSFTSAYDTTAQDSTLQAAQY